MKKFGQCGKGTLEGDDLMAECLEALFERFYTGGGDFRLLIPSPLKERIHYILGSLVLDKLETQLHPVQFCFWLSPGFLFDLFNFEV